MNFNVEVNKMKQLHSCVSYLGADALLLFSSTYDIRGIYIHKEVYYVVAKNLDHVVGISYDGIHIYWTHLVSGEETIMRSREDGSHMEVVVDAGKYVALEISCYVLTTVAAFLIILQNKSNRIEISPNTVVCFFFYDV
jgi:hypothetical protein